MVKRSGSQWSFMITNARALNGWMDASVESQIQTFRGMLRMRVGAFWLTKWDLARRL